MDTYDYEYFMQKQNRNYAHQKYLERIPARLAKGWANQRRDATVEQSQSGKQPMATQ